MKRDSRQWWYLTITVPLHCTAPCQITPHTKTHMLNITWLRRKYSDAPTTSLFVCRVRILYFLCLSEKREACDAFCLGVSFSCLKDFSFARWDEFMARCSLSMLVFLIIKMGLWWISHWKCFTDCHCWWSLLGNAL